jgi:hypothetical protein
MESKSKPNNPELYEEVKKKVIQRYTNKRSPFVSGAIVKEYKREGGTFTGNRDNTKLRRWFKEKWVNVNPIVGKEKDQYAFFRPTVKVSDKTPSTVKELKGNLKSLVKQKQEVKYGDQVEDIKGKGMVLMNERDYKQEHKKLINLLNLGKKFVSEAEEQAQEVKSTPVYDVFKPRIKGGMLVRSQPYSKF